MPSKIILPSSENIIRDISLLRDTSARNSRFFHGDPKTEFLDVRMGSLFAIAKKYSSISMAGVEELMESNYFEVRVAATAIMDFKARDKKTTDAEKKQLFDLYIKRHDRIDNWDMVDRSAPHVVGAYLADKPKKILYTLAASKNIWERRTAIVSTAYFIKKGNTADTFKIAECLLLDKEELINKAVGSWIREAGKKDKESLMAFLVKYAKKMPATTFRYATEKLGTADKKQLLAIRKA